MDLLAVGCQAIADATATTTDDKTLLVAAKCRGLLAGYLARWSDPDYRFTSVEETVQSELWNPETGRRSRTFRLAGKLDAKGWDRNGHRIILDHKTCSEEIEDPTAPYWRQLVVEGQPTHYMLLEHLNGRKADEAVWDVMRKPGIKPAAVSKKEATETLKTRFYYGREMSDASLGYLRENGRETLEMYEARLAWDCTKDRPGRYFQRRTIPRLDSDICEWANEVWGHAQDILYARRMNRWPRNAGACMAYGRPCKFLGICSGYDTTESDNWKRKEQVHNELPVLDGDGRDVLTNSRIKAFQTCRRKHYFEYELGIKRATDDEEESEALYFGTLWHIALEAVLKSQVTEEGEQIEHSDNGVPAADGNGTTETLQYF